MVQAVSTCRVSASKLHEHEVLTLSRVSFPPLRPPLKLGSKVGPNERGGGGFTTHCPEQPLFWQLMILLHISSRSSPFPGPGPVSYHLPSTSTDRGSLGAMVTKEGYLPWLTDFVQSLGGKYILVIGIFRTG
ncbi:unnamed protein product [Diplocarpon coronariae]